MIIENKSEYLFHSEIKKFVCIYIYLVKTVLSNLSRTDFESVVNFVDKMPAEI